VGSPFAEKRVLHRLVPSAPGRSPREGRLDHVKPVALPKSVELIPLREEFADVRSKAEGHKRLELLVFLPLLLSQADKPRLFQGLKKIAVSFCNREQPVADLYDLLL
jgi:hypothetical protein